MTKAKKTSVRITALKAPWPEGSKVGDMVDFDGEVPAWAAGKCVVMTGDAKADAEPADSLQGANAMLAEAKRENDELKGMLAARDKDLEKASQAMFAAQNERDSLKAELDKLKTAAPAKK